MNKFYYLHKLDTEMPKNENGFDYLVYSENPLQNPITLNDGISYCSSHHSLGNPTWNHDDEQIDVIGNENVIVVSFKKAYEEVGFTVWKNSKLM
jgi:hypothetical protein